MRQLVDAERICLAAVNSEVDFARAVAQPWQDAGDDRSASAAEAIRQCTNLTDLADVILNDAKAEVAMDNPLTRLLLTSDCETSLESLLNDYQQFAGYEVEPLSVLLTSTAIAACYEDSERLEDNGRMIRQRIGEDHWMSRFATHMATKQFQNTEQRGGP